MDEAGKPGNPQSAKAPEEPRRVFISYASQDAAVAQKVCSALEASGFLCWIAPRNVVPGTMYADGIVHAIDESSILVLILSEHAIASAHVGREIERAVSKRHPVVALRIDAAPLTAAFEYFLNQSQWIEGGGSDAAVTQLVGAVGQHLAPGNATSPTNANHGSADHPEVATRRRAWIIAAVVVTILLAGGYFWVDKAWHPKHDTTASTAAISDKSIAVLPFTDMSEKKDQEYFADGMAEETLSQLAKIPGLKVIGRTSSFQFKQKADDLRKIGTTLGVAYCTRGSVRRTGDRLRVTAQLIDTRDGARRWSDSYDRSASDALAVQDQIAAGLARALQLEVNTAPRRSPRTAEAYDSYLRGLHAREGFDQAGFEKAVADFKHTLQLDPDFVPAAEALARALFEEASWYFVRPQVGFEQSRTAATARVCRRGAARRWSMG